MTFAYYNEIDPKTAAWLKRLIKNGSITQGEVDERSITEVDAIDLIGFDRCHFFAGIGTWDFCLNESGWGDSPIWTASLPCQPFSAAGKGLGKEDERHLLPHFLDLVRKCKPRTIIGEQVANAIGSTGLRVEVEDLQLLQKREAYLRILAELQRSSHEGLHDLSCFGEIKEEIEKERKFRFLSKVESREQRKSTGEYGNFPSKREGNDIGYNIGLGATKDRCGDLRSDGHTFRSGNSEGMECAIIGQDRQQSGISQDKHSCGDLCVECDDEYMGSAEDIGSIEWNHESAQEEINRAYRKTNEQIERAIAHGWLDDLQANMEAEGYAVGHCVLGAHSVGAPHIRQRLYWVADSKTTTRIGAEQGSNSKPYGREFGGLANTDIARAPESKHRKNIGERSANGSFGSCADDIEWLYCRDNKYRPIKPGIQPLVNGVTGRVVYSSDPSAPINANATQEARVMRLKGYGNAIQAQTAIAFIKAYMSTV